MTPGFLQRLHADRSLLPFAVVDGALFTDLPAELAQLGGDHQRLYLGELEPEVARVAPWLVPLPPGSPAAAWWAARPGEACEGITGLAACDGLIALRRHLRTLTTVIHPDGETVLFRFYDPVVLNQVMPLLNDAQQARLFGPLVELWADLESGGGPIVHLRRPIAEPPPRGPLRLTQEQIEALDGHANARLHREIADFLTGKFPKVAEALGHEELLALVARADDEASEFGLETERDIARWSTLSLLAGEGFARSVEAVPILRPLKSDPDAGPANARAVENLIRTLSGH